MATTVWAAKHSDAIVRGSLSSQMFIALLVAHIGLSTRPTMISATAKEAMKQLEIV